MLRMLTAPCKDCKARHIGCHSECGSYQDFHNEREQVYKRKEASRRTLYVSRAAIKSIEKNLKNRKRFK